MPRCSNCGWVDAQYRRQGRHYGCYASPTHHCVSDTEYDNVDDDEDWIDDTSPVPRAPGRFPASSRPDDHNYFRFERANSIHRRQLGHRPQPVEAALKLQKNDSYDCDSVYSGTFTIDLSTLQNAQNTRLGSATAFDRSAEFGVNTRACRPHSAMSFGNAWEKANRRPQNYQSYHYARDHRTESDHHHHHHHHPDPPSFSEGGRRIRERMPDFQHQYETERWCGLCEDSGRVQPTQRRRNYNGYTTDQPPHQPPHGSNCCPRSDWNDYRRREDCPEVDTCQVEGEGPGQGSYPFNGFTRGRTEQRRYVAGDEHDFHVRDGRYPDRRSSGPHPAAGPDDHPHPVIDAIRDYASRRDGPAPQMTGSPSHLADRIPAYKLTRTDQPYPLPSGYSRVRTQSDEPYSSFSNGVEHEGPEAGWKSTHVPDAVDSGRCSSSLVGEQPLKGLSPPVCLDSASRDTRDGSATNEYRNPNPESSIEYCNESRRMFGSSSVPAKIPEGFSYDRPSNNENSACADDTDFPPYVSGGLLAGHGNESRNREQKANEQDAFDCGYRPPPISYREPASSSSAPTAAAAAADRRRDDNKRQTSSQYHPFPSRNEDSQPNGIDSGRSSAGGSTCVERDIPGTDRPYSAMDYRSCQLQKTSDRQHVGDSSRASLTHLSDRATLTGRKPLPTTRARSADRSEQGRKYSREKIVRSRNSSADRQVAASERRGRLEGCLERPVADDERTSSAIRDMTSELTRMTQSVKGFESGSTGAGTVETRRSNEHGSKRPEINSGHLTVSVNHVGAPSSTESIQKPGRHKDEEKWKAKQMELRQTGFRAGDASLLAQIQDDLQTKMTELTSELEQTPSPVCRSVVCESNYAETTECRKVNNTALIDSRVLLADDQMLPKFRATVDVSLFTSPSATVDVSLNSRTHKLVVDAETDPDEGPVRTLRQNITLPRFADENNIQHKTSSDGLLQIEVPLLYYFPGADTATSQGHARAFVYEVREDPQDSTRRLIEIVVDGGREFVLADLRVGVDGDRLLIEGERARSRRTSNSASPAPRRSSSSVSAGARQMIKQYALPAGADVASITARRCDDGRLAVLVPVRR